MLSMQVASVIMAERKNKKILKIPSGTQKSGSTVWCEIICTNHMQKHFRSDARVSNRTPKNSLNINVLQTYLPFQNEYLAKLIWETDPKFNYCTVGLFMCIIEIYHMNFSSIIIMGHIIYCIVETVEPCCGQKGN